MKLSCAKLRSDTTIKTSHRTNDDDNYYEDDNCGLLLAQEIVLYGHQVGENNDFLTATDEISRGRYLFHGFLLC